MFMCLCVCLCVCLWFVYVMDLFLHKPNQFSGVCALKRQPSNDMSSTVLNILGF